jgi:Reverse transcriptase (RNA-dependent DNA polymerase)
MLKEDPITSELNCKARATCNGGKKYGQAVTVAETYATCVEQPACRLYWSVTASEGLIAMGADAGNAFAEAPPATEPFYMRIDDQFTEWWTEHLNLPPIPSGYVLPVNHALQGHPEAPSLWEKHIHGIIVKLLGFAPTTHEKCLYSRRHPQRHDDIQMILRQVDDFSVSADTQAECKDIIKQIGSHLKVPLNDLGIIQKFNGVNIQQTKWFVKISCEDYILKILMNHHWQDLKAANLPVPMRSDSKYQRDLEQAPRPTTQANQQQTQVQAGFSFRMAVGELIYALVVARLEISFAVIKLSQYSSNPALIHYQATKNVFGFLNQTRADGLVYWRQKPREDLPEVSPPPPRSSPINRLRTPSITPTTLLAYSDSDWGSDSSHRRSVTGTIILLSGAAVIYTTKYQKAVALSSTEAEFVSASDAGKTALYMRTLLADLGFQQNNPTKLFIDNTGAVFMVDAQAPTKRTRHVDIRYFALLQWSESNQLKAEAITTEENISDSMTKALGRIKFHQQADIYMGRTPPSYVPHMSVPRPATISTFHIVPIPLETLSALHNQIYSAYTLHATDLHAQSMGG